MRSCALLLFVVLLAGCGDDGTKRGAHLLRVDRSLLDGSRTETWRLPSGRIQRLWIPGANFYGVQPRWLDPHERTPQ